MIRALPFAAAHRRLLRLAGTGLLAFFGLVGILVVLLHGGAPQVLPKLPDSQEGESRIPLAAPAAQSAAVTLSATALRLQPRAGLADRQIVRLTATGNLPTPVRHARSPSPGLRLDGDCLNRRLLAPGESCVLGVSAAADAVLETIVTIDHGDALPASEILVEVRPQRDAEPAAVPAPVAPSASRQWAMRQLTRPIGADGSAILATTTATATAVDVRPAAASQYNAAFQDRSIPSARFTQPVDRGRIITQDRIVKAVLQTPILSTVPGRVVALVARPLRSSDTGAVLLPAGTSVLGVSQGGGARAGVIWQRMITPAGASIALESSIAADRMGRPGIPADQYSQFWQRFGGAIATSVVNFAATGYLAGNRPAQVTDNLAGTSRSENPRQEAARQLRQDLAEIGRTLARDGAREGPVSIVAGGTEIDIVLGQDLYVPAPDEPQQPTPASTSQASLNPATPPARNDDDDRR